MAYIGNQAATAFTSFDKQIITGNGGTTYTLSHAVANEQEIEVFVNNVRQEGGAGKAFTVSGNQITFTGAVVSSDSCYVNFQGKAIQTVVPPDGSVGTAKLADSAVTTSKLATTIAPTNLETTASTFKMTDLNSNAFYRAGTFVPAFSSTVATDQDASIFNNYSHQKGFYTRIGNLVFTTVDIKLSSSFGFINGGATGQNLTVVNLPFKFANTQNQYSSISCGFFASFTGWSASYTPMGYGVLNTKRIDLTYAVANGTSSMTTDFFNTANVHIVFDITFETDDA